MYINYSSSSGLKTASAQISTRSGALTGIDVRAATAGANTFTIYDSENSTTAGKTVVAVVEVDAGMVSVNHDFFIPVAINRGIYVVVSGAGADYSYLVRYTL